MNIRLERPDDYREVENLTREAFWNVYRPGCTEHYILKQYRNNPDFIPELDFVMEEDDKIIGHVMYSKAEITCEDGSKVPAWTFGPISIHPEYKRKGYGLKLLQYSLDKARQIGIGVLCMEGNIEFYKHAGFDLACRLNIHYHAEPKDSEVPYFLAQELIPGYLNGIEGTYQPPKGYFAADENPEDFEAYEATFPKREKHLAEGQLPQFCQSCGMPMTDDATCGNNADGSINFDYCKYCFKDGAFTGNFNMEEMIDFCSQFVEQYNKDAHANLTREEYKGLLRSYYPMLKRWRTPADKLPHADSPLKQQLIKEINALAIAGMPHIDNLFILQGDVVNIEYVINENNVRLLDNAKTYWGTQVEKTGSNGRRYGIACDENYILISEYGANGSDAEIVVLKRR
ncbi:MAG: GNAT family N-acetyltransferase [Prevotella sp.]